MGDEQDWRLGDVLFIRKKKNKERIKGIVKVWKDGRQQNLLSKVKTTSGKEKNGQKEGQKNERKERHQVLNDEGTHTISKAAREKNYKE